MTHLASKLVTREAKDPKTTRLCKVVVQTLQFSVVHVGLASFRGHVDDDANMTPANKYNEMSGA